MLRLRTLGECLIELGDAPLSPEADVLFTVLLYLCAERDRRLARSAVAEMFWPGLPPRRARHCLRQVLYRLRALGLEVEAEHEYLRLPAARIAPGFAAAPSREQFDRERRAGTLVLGPYLGGHVPEVSPAFAEWFDRYRGHLHFHVRRVLLEVAREHRLRGEWGDVEWLARECLRLDPLNEEATLALAESMAMVGGKAEAIAYLDRYIADLGGDASTARLPATVLRRRIAERFPTRRYAGPADRCFVGRATLLATVATALLRARNGDGGALLLWGAAGIGKSRLAAEAAKIAVMEGVRILRVPCEESASARPLAVFLESLPELLTYPGAIGCAPASLALLRRLLRFDPSAADDASEVTLSPGSLRRAVVDLVDAVTHEVPLLLLVEDAQWADPASWALLRDLVEWSARKPVLLVFTSRTPHPTPMPPARATTRLERHELPPLDDAAAMELVRAVAAEAEMQIPDDAAAWCLEAGEGNPLFLQELAGHWLETGQTRGTPPSLQMLLEGRLARLTPTARRVLQAAVVLGSYATPERLGTVLGHATHVVLAALDELAGEQLIVEREYALAPRHDMVAQTAMTGLKSAALRLLHRSAGEVLERQLLTTPSIDLLSQCYEHWSRGLCPDRAGAALTTNVPRLLPIGAAPAAIELLDRALGTVAASSLRDNMLRVRVVAEQHDSQFYRALDSLKLLISGSHEMPLAQRIADKIDFIDADWRLSSSGQQHLTELLRYSSTEDLPTRVRLRAIHVGLAISDNTNSPDHARNFWAHLSTVAPTELPDVHAHRIATMIYHCGFGDARTGLQAAHELQRLVSAEASQAADIRVTLNAGDAERVVGNPITALRLLRAAYSIARTNHTSYLAMLAADKIASIYLDRHEVETAQRWFDRAVTAARSCDQCSGRVVITETLARLHIARRSFDDALRAIDELQSFSHAGTNPRAQRFLITVRAECDLERSDSQIGAALLEELYELHLAMRERTGHDRTVIALVRALSRHGDKKKAHSLLSAYVHEQRRAGGAPMMFCDPAELSQSPN